jgi:alpha-D-ribose 1-methylphosphonate 5-phosphate C-P lyase
MKLRWPELWEIAEGVLTSSTGPLIAARYDGRCRACGSRWEAGDNIAFDEDEGSWVCEDCAAS